jgi:hypothetical protein
MPVFPLQTLQDSGDILFVSLFAAEALVKALGLGPATYLRSPWHKLDLVILVASLTSLVAASLDLTVFRALQLLRFQRMLRMLKLVK